MDRRRFLSLLTAGSLPLTGCVGSDNPEVRTVTVTVTRIPTTTTSTTTVSTTTSPETTETTETNTETTTEETTETPDPEEQAAKHIDAAEDELWEAYNAYVDGNAGDWNLTDVDAQSEDFDADSVLEHIKNAFDELEKAGTGATDEQGKAILRADTAGTFLQHVTRSQSNLIDAYQAVQKLLDGIESGSISDVKQARDILLTAVPAANDYQKQASTLSLDGIGQFPFLGRQEAENTIDKLWAERRMFADFQTASNPLVQAVNHLEEAESEYSTGEFNIAVTEFGNGREKLAKVQQSIGRSRPEYLVIIVQTTDCYVDALVGYANKFKIAAEAGLNDEHDKQRDSASEARDELSACDTELSPPS